MKLRSRKTAQSISAGFTLAEVLIALFIFGMVSVGIIYGYVQTNRMAEWSSISLAAQSYASQGAEQARAADWNPRGFPPSTGPGSFDELPATNYVLSGTNYILDVPIKGDPSASDFCFFVTNHVSISNVSTNPPLRQIRSDAVWIFYATGKVFTNTCIILRAPDQ